MDQSNNQNQSDQPVTDKSVEEKKEISPSMPTMPAPIPPSADAVPDNNLVQDEQVSVPEPPKQRMPLPKEKEEPQIDQAVLNRGVPRSSVPTQPAPEGKPWEATMVGKKEAPLPGLRSDFGTPWQPKQDITGIDLPRMEMPTQKIAAVNFDKPAIIESEAPKKKMRMGWLKTILRVILILLPIGLIAVAGVMAYGVTYQGKTYGQEEIEKAVSGFILELPFTPKTPGYVLGKAIERMTAVKSLDFEFSAATTSNETLAGTIGKLEMLIKGDGESLGGGDFRGSFRVDVTDEFQADFRITGPKVYLKINKFFPSLMAFGGEESVLFSRQIERRWFYLDLSDLETEAGDLLDDYRTKAESEEAFNLSLGLEKKLLAAAVLEEEELDGESMKLIRFDFNQVLIDEVLNEITPKSGSSADYYVFPKGESDYRLTDVQAEIYVDDHDLIRRFNFKATLRIRGETELEIPLPLNEQGSVGFSLSGRMNNFDKKVTVEEPLEAPSVLEFLEEVTGQDYSQGLTGSMLPNVLGDFDIHSLE